MIRFFVKHVFGKDGFPVFVVRKAVGEVVYVVDVFRDLIILLFLKLQNRRLRKEHCRLVQQAKRLETAIGNGNGRSRV